MKNIHVILLKKNLEEEIPQTREWLPEADSEWIALGHFDAILTYDIEVKEDFFLAMKEDRLRVSSHNDAQVCYHPLYLVPDKERSDDCAKESWNDQYFIAVVRIHLADTCGLKDSVRALYDWLKTIFDQTDAQYRYYYATEFSDVVLDVRMNRFSELVKHILTLRDHTGIGKMYTYFGINAAKLQSGMDDIDEEDCIPRLQMRFIATSSETADQVDMIQEKLGKTPVYSINGVDDYLLQYENLRTKKLMDLYREWMYNEAYKGLRASRSISRIGVIFDQGIPKLQAKTDLSIFGEHLAKLRDQVWQCIEKKHLTGEYVWFASASEITNTLIRMSKTPVLDEALYLMAPALEAFLQNVLSEIRQMDEYGEGEGYEPPSDRYHQYIQYIRNFAYFLEHLLRIEGQLSQNPEIRPMIYHIPIFMLEYTTAFLNEVAMLLQKKDNCSVRYVFSVFPVPDPYVTAIEMFEADQERPGLVELLIPIEDLYSPQKILSELCHEISHYVGERYRKRKERKKYYCSALAAIACSRLFCNESSGLIQFFETEFSESLDDIEQPTLVEMKQILMERTEQLLDNEESVADFIFRYLEEAHKGDSPITYPDTDKKQEIFAKYEDISILFRECYADICMMLILKIPSDHYVASILSEIEKYSLEGDSTNTCKDMLSLRIHVVLNALELDLKYGGELYKDTWEDVQNIITRIQQRDLSCRGRTYAYPLPAATITALEKYAAECADCIETILQPDETEEVRKYYTRLKTSGAEDTESEFSFIIDKIDHSRITMQKYENRCKII